MGKLTVIFLVVVCLVLASYVNAKGKDGGNGQDIKENEPDQGKGKNRDERYGMDEATFQETRRCMKKLRNMSAKHHGKPEMNDMDDSILDGDTVYTLGQCEEAIMDLKEGGATRRKRFIRTTNRWSMPVRYEFNSTYPEVDRPQVLGAINQIEKESCIRFQAYDDAVHGPNGNRIEFISGSGCWSYIGYESSRIPQPVSIKSPGCTVRPGTSIHEILHALGMYHHMGRTDRNDYVTVNYTNIQSGKVGNFNIKTGTSYGAAYDIASVMHYSPTAFAIDCNYNTIDVNEPLYTEFTMNAGGGPSFSDMMTLNMAYCSGICTNALTQPCQNGGYQDPNDCTKCKCPEDFGGDFCEGTGVSSAGCTPATGILQASLTEQCVQSPNYGVSNYNVGDQCSWTIQAPTGLKVKAYFSGPFDLYCLNFGCFKTCNHWVELKYKADKMRRGGRFCCTGTGSNLPSSVVSEDEVMLVSFDARYPETITPNTYKPSADRMDGFKLCYVAYDPPTTTTTTTTTTTPPTTTTTTTTTTTPPTTTTTRKRKGKKG